MPALSPLDLEMDRRRFLALLGSLAATGALAACASPSPSPSPVASLVPTLAPTPGSLPPSPAPVGRYDILRRLQEIIRRSPDHLGGLAATVVAGKDPAAIVGFVHEHIAVLPSTARGADPTTDVRWGHRTALRAGAGTLRERADLIVDLLRQAGIEGKVVTIPRPSSYQAGGPTTPAFAPDAAAIAALWDPIDPTHPPIGGAADDAGSRADSATERLLAALPSELRTARLVAPDLPDRVPAVEFQHDGATRWATALGGEPLLATKPDGLLGGSDAVVPRVSVAVSVALNPPAGATIDRTVLHEVLHGEWPADQVAGRQLVLGFAVPGSPVAALGQDPTAAPIRQPVLRLVAGEPLGDAVPVVMGTYISTAGGLVETAPDDPSRVIGPLGPLLAPWPGRHCRAVGRRPGRLRRRGRLSGGRAASPGQPDGRQPGRRPRRRRLPGHRGRRPTGPDPDRQLGPGRDPSPRRLRHERERHELLAEPRPEGGLRGDAGEGPRRRCRGAPVHGPGHRRR